MTMNVSRATGSLNTTRQNWHLGGASKGARQKKNNSAGGPW